MIALVYMEISIYVGYTRRPVVQDDFPEWQVVERAGRTRLERCAEAILRHRSSLRMSDDCMNSEGARKCSAWDRASVTSKHEAFDTVCEDRGSSFHSSRASGKRSASRMLYRVYRNRKLQTRAGKPPICAVFLVFCNAAYVHGVDFLR